MRRVSKSKGAAASARASPKRALSKKKSYAEDSDTGDEVDGVAGRSTSPRNGEVEKDAPVKDKDPVKDEDEEDEPESFEVQAILGSRARHGKQQFKIRWKGYGPADDTWEDEENINSPDLVAAFLKGPSEKEEVAKKTTKKQPKKRSSTASAKPKPVAKKAKVDNSEDKDTEWEVSKIVDYVNLKDGTRQFLVQWKGFSPKQNTWEPEANLNCEELIQKFLSLEKERDESTRETREVRKQVNRYNPELTKRSSHRTSSKRRISYHDLE